MTKARALWHQLGRIHRLILARARWAWRGPVVGAIGLKVQGTPPRYRAGGNARDRRKQIRNLSRRPRVGIGKTVARHVRVHV